MLLNVMTINNVNSNNIINQKKLIFSRENALKTSKTYLN